MHDTAFDVHYSDGQTARRHAVQVSVTENGLAFVVSGKTILWAWVDVRAIERAIGPLGRGSARPTAEDLQRQSG
jgi:hypothetical protein